MERRPAWLAIGIAGAIAALILMGLGALTLLLALISGVGTGVAMVDLLSALGFLLLGLGVGVPLVVHAWRGWHARPSQPFIARRFWLLGLALILLFGLDALAIWLSFPGVLVAIFHLLTFALPPLVVLGLVGWALRGKGGSWREAVAGLSGGSFFGIGSSVIIEIGLLLVLIVLIVIYVMTLGPEQQERLMRLAEQFREMSPQTLSDELLREAAGLILSPATVIILLVSIAVVIPLIEEVFKTLSAGVVGHWLRPAAPRAFFWGVAGGAGFALAENLLSSSMAGSGDWSMLAVAVSRSGTTAMHALAGGLVGWGWGQLWRERRPLRLIGSYALAVTIHGVWNAAAIGTALLGLVTMGGTPSPVPPRLASVGAVVLSVLLVVIAIAAFLALPVIGYRLARREVPGSEDDRPSA